MELEKASSTPIADAVRRYLDNDGWKYQTKVQDGLVTFNSGVALPNGEFRSNFDADDGNERFAVYVYFSIFIPEDRRLGWSLST